VKQQCGHNTEGFRPTLRDRAPHEGVDENGLGIGADVPFFFLDGAAIAVGIGERLKKIELPDLSYVLINPNFEVSTRWAYQNFILTKGIFILIFKGL